MKDKERIWNDVNTFDQRVLDKLGKRDYIYTSICDKIGHDFHLMLSEYASSSAYARRLMEDALSALKESVSLLEVALQENKKSDNTYDSITKHMIDYVLNSQPTNYKGEIENDRGSGLSEGRECGD